MPLLSEEVPECEELSDEEREAYKQAALELGMDFPSGSEDEDDYYE